MVLFGTAHNIFDLRSLDVFLILHRDVSIYSFQEAGAHGYPKQLL